MLIDLHTHTFPASDDSNLSLPELVQAAKEAGLDGICITDHDWFWEGEALARLGKEYGLLVFPGVELTTEEGHLLVFGIEKYIFGMHRASFVKKLVEEKGGAIVVAHPYRRQFYDDDGYAPALEQACQNSLYSLADAIEVLNGRGKPIENNFSQEVSQRLALKGVAGSDAHTREQVGLYATRFEREIRNLQDFIAELKAGRFTPWGRALE